MSGRLGSGRFLLAAMLAGALGCGKKPAPTPDVAPLATATATTGGAAIPAAAAGDDARPAASAPLAADAVRARVAAFFAQLRDGTDLEPLRALCASPVEEFLTLKHVDPSAVVGSVRAFFRDKHGVSYVPELDASVIEPVAGGVVVRVPVAVSWAGPPPAAVDAGGAGVRHDTTVEAVLGFSDAGLLTRYVEARIRRPLLRVTDDGQCQMAGLSLGDRVADLGDTTVRPLPEGSHQQRHVQATEGELWVDDRVAWSTASPSGGTITGRVVCLAPVDPTSAPAPRSPAVAAPTDACPAGMARLEAGEYAMGERGVVEGKERLGGDYVGVDAFCLDTTEVTVDAFAACVRAGQCPSEHVGDETGSGYPAPYAKSARCNYGVEGRGNHPINCVDLNDGVEFCRALGKRLPTEEEWEWAARGGAEGRPHPWGKASADAQLCWSGKQKREGTCPVGAFPAGDAPGGLHDLVGNVWEWSVPGEGAITRSAGPAPGRWTSVRAVTHGSGWATKTDEVSGHALLSAGFRSDQADTTRSALNGFRCARSVR